MAARAEATSTSGTPRAERALDDQRGGAGAHGRAAKSWPSLRKPGTQKNSVPGSTLRLS